MNLRTIFLAASLSASLAGSVACGGGASEGETDTTANSAEDGARHPVVIHRPLAAGQHLKVEVQARQVVEVVESVDNPEEMVIDGFTEDTQVVFVAAVLIREVDEAGRVAHAEVTIERFTELESADAIVAPGTQMVVGWRGEQMYAEIDGEGLEADVMERLELAFPLEGPGSALGDALFGTDTPRAVGEAWDINETDVVEDLGDDGYSVTETQLTGETRFSGLNPCGDTECMVLEAAFAAEQVTVAEEWEMADFEAGELEALVRMQLPTDTLLPVYSIESALRGTFVVELREGDETSQTLATLERGRAAIFTRLPAE